MKKKIRVVVFETFYSNTNCNQNTQTMLKHTNKNKTQKHETPGLEKKSGQDLTESFIIQREVNTY